MSFLDYILPFRKLRPNGSAPAQASRTSEALARDARPEPTSLGELAERMEEDPQVRFAKWVLTGNIKAVQVQFSAEGGGPRADALKDQLQALWDQTITSAIECIGKGRVAYEKVLGWDADSECNVIRKLEPLPFSKTEMCLSDDGSFDGILLTAGGEEIPIPAEKSWWLALDPTSLEPHGRSRYVGAPQRVWEERAEAFRLRKKYRRRFMLGWAKAHIPKTKTDEHGQIVDNFNALGDAYDAARSGGLVMFENVYDERTGRWTEDIEQMPALETMQPIIDDMIRLDVELLRSFGIPEKTVIEGDAVGSYAMITQQMLTLYAVIEDILGQITDSFQRYVIDKTVALNFADEQAVKITISFPRLTSKQQDSLIVQIVTGLFANPGMFELLLTGGIDFRELLEQAGLPVTEQFEIIAAEIAARLQGMANTGQIGLSNAQHTNGHTQKLTPVGEYPATGPIGTGSRPVPQDRQTAQGTPVCGDRYEGWYRPNGRHHYDH